MKTKLLIVMVVLFAAVFMLEQLNNAATPSLNNRATESSLIMYQTKIRPVEKDAVIEPIEAVTKEYQGLIKVLDDKEGAASNQLLTPEQVVQNIRSSDGIFNQEAVYASLTSDDFSQYLDVLATYTINDTEQVQLSNAWQLLSQSSELAKYDHRLECGNGICGLYINDMYDDDVDLIEESISINSLFGSRFVRKRVSDSGNVDYRVIYQMDETSSLTMTTANN